MTEREKEIVLHIRENPFISQQALADILGIERSSVAVHISNLIKKGVIKGKGYIIEDDSYVVVIGGSNMDILGTPHKHLRIEDSNPGTITHSLGGVGRNIAENLAHLKIPVKLLSVVGQDIYGQQIYDQTRQSGVDVHYMKQSGNYPTSTYLSLLDAQGNMHVALSDMTITEEIDIPYIKANDALLKSAAYIVLDTNLSEKTITYIVTHYKHIPIILDTVSTAKAVKIKNAYAHLHCIKTNRYEASELLDFDIRDTDDIYRALEQFQLEGINCPIITLGSEGVAYMHHNKPVILPNDPVTVVNANGAGDAFTAATIYGMYHKLSVDKSILLAMDLARQTIESEETVHPNPTLHL